MCWVDAYGAIYPRGWQGTWLRMRELMDSEDDVEYALVVRLKVLLAPPPPPVTNNSYSSMIEDPSELAPLMKTGLKL